MANPNIEGVSQAAVLTGGTMGAMVGNSASEKVGFHGSTGAVQHAAITAVTLSGTYASDYAALQTAVNALITALKETGYTA